MSDIYVQIIITIVAIVAIIFRLSTVYYKTEQTPNQTKAQPGRLIVPILFLAFGLFLLWNGNEQRNLARESIEWPITNGHVICSKNASNSKHDTEYLDHNGWPGGKHGSVVKYSYTINGHTYSSWCLAYNKNVNQNYGDLETKYPPGASVAVRYSPSDPSKSCLETGNTNLLGQLFYMSLIVLTVALVIAYQPVNGNIR